MSRSGPDIARRTQAQALPSASGEEKEKKKYTERMNENGKKSAKNFIYIKWKEKQKENNNKLHAAKSSRKS